jgi:2,4-dienoyl-CoA reductase-like NADH-dependent reductase (Old Yellow Enzyme family)
MAITAPLFEPIKIRQLALKNRIVMAPMTRYFSPGGVPTPEVAAYYRRRAEGQAGLIVTEGVGIDHESAVDNENVPVMHGEAALSGWRKVVEEVHQAGGIIFPQLWHMGPMLVPGQGRYPAAPPMRPSGLWGARADHVVWGLDADAVQKAQTPITPMSSRDIEDVIAAYARSAENARKIGFDGIAIHGAHGYMPDAFLWEATNQRTDRYNGGPTQRTLFVREMVRAVRAAAGPDMPIMLRFSQWKQQDYTAKLARTPKELEQILAPIAAAGVDVFDASTRRFWVPEFEGSDLNLAGWTRKITGRPTMTVGSVGLSNDLYEALDKGKSETADLSELMRRFNQQEFDLVGVGRAFLSDPAFPIKIKEGRPFVPYEKTHVEALI